MELIQFQAVALNGGIDVPGPGINAACEGKGVLQSVAVEPGTTIENVTATVVVEDDSLLWRVREKVVLELLAEELGARQTDRVVFFTATDIKEDHSLSVLKSLLQAPGLNQQGLVAFVAGKQDSNGFFQGNVVAGADFAEGFVVAVGAGLAAPDVIGGEKCTTSTREQGKEILHTLVGTNFDIPGHGRSMTQRDPISSVCLQRNVRIVRARWSETRNRGSISCRI